MVYNVDWINFFVEKMKLNEKYSLPLLCCKIWEIELPERILHAKRKFCRYSCSSDVSIRLSAIEKTTLDACRTQKWQPIPCEVQLRMQPRDSEEKDVFNPSENGLWIFLPTSPVKKPSFLTIWINSSTKTKETKKGMFSLIQKTKIGQLCWYGCFALTNTWKEKWKLWYFSAWGHSIGAKSVE